MTDTTHQTTEADVIASMQHTIDELHGALWIALHLEGGEIISTAEERAAMPKAGKIEWLWTADKDCLIIKAMEAENV